jgi:ketosteroid isomerase-like protein
MDESERRETNKARVRELFTNLYEWADRGIDFFRSYYTDDTVMEMPQMGYRVEGLEDLMLAIESIRQNFTHWRHGSFEFHECLDPDELIWEADADAHFRHSGEPYEQRYVLFLHMRDGKIARYKEYVNTAALAAFPQVEA